MKFLMLVCVEEDRFENEAAAEAGRGRGGHRGQREFSLAR